MDTLTAHQGNWPDAKLGPFAPKDPQFPLPGNVGIDFAQFPQQATTESGLQRRTVAEALLDLESTDIRKAVVMDTYIKDVAENYDEIVEAEVITVNSALPLSLDKVSDSFLTYF